MRQEFKKLVRASSSVLPPSSPNPFKRCLKRLLTILRKMLGNSLSRQLKRQHHGKLSVGFFVPTPGFEGNFGELPLELDRRGFITVWLYGTSQAYEKSLEKRKLLITGGMVSKLTGFHAIVTASVMDCLPTGVVRVLHDHISYAHFDIEPLVQNLLRGDERIDAVFHTKQELFGKMSAFVAFLPFYDLILSSSKPVTDLSVRSLNFSGYDTGKRAAQVFERLDYKSIENLVEVSDYRKKIRVVQSGYCKLDSKIKKYSCLAPDKVIVFAPTPNDLSGNKSGALWQDNMTVNVYAAELLEALCCNFNDYKIVFKPYKDELESLISTVSDKLKAYTNFETDMCGSNYWPLYSRAKILISDFSSTAYTFALGVGRPVVFFSPNERNLSARFVESSFCKSRKEVGVIATSVIEVISAINTVLVNYDEFISKVDDFRKRNNASGNAASLAADAISDLIEARRSGLKESPKYEFIELKKVGQYD